MKTVNSIWVILDDQGSYCAFGSKVAWISSGAAKNAFSCGHPWDYTGENSYGTPVKLVDCPEYQLVEIKKETACNGN